MATVIFMKGLSIRNTNSMPRCSEILRHKRQKQTMFLQQNVSAKPSHFPPKVFFSKNMSQLYTQRCSRYSFPNYFLMKDQCFLLLFPMLGFSCVFISSLNKFQSNHLCSFWCEIENKRHLYLPNTSELRGECKGVIDVVTMQHFSVFVNIIYWGPVLTCPVCILSVCTFCVRSVSISRWWPF